MPTVPEKNGNPEVGKTPADLPPPADVIALALDGKKLAAELAKSGLLDELAARLKALNDRLPEGIKASPEQLQALVANLMAQYSASVLEAVTTQLLAQVVSLAQKGKGPVSRDRSALA